MLAPLLCALAFVAQVEKPPVITPAEAAKHVGQMVVVRGTVSQIVLSVNLTTHINFGGVYPDHALHGHDLQGEADAVPGREGVRGQDRPDPGGRAPLPGQARDRARGASADPAGRVGDTLESFAERAGRSPRRRTSRGGKSGLHRAACWLTASGGNPRESATENDTAELAGVTPRVARVKRCGKSAPPSWRHGGTGKTPRGARPNRGAFEVGPAEAPGLVAGPRGQPRG